MSDTPTPESIADVLDDAADYIEKYGWTQGALQLDTGEVCAMGAISRCATDALPGWAFKSLSRYLDRQIIPKWNDQPGRTKQEVLDALRGCSKDLRCLADGAA